MKFFWIPGSLLLTLSLVTPSLTSIAQAETPPSDRTQLAQTDPTDVLQNVCYVANLQQGQLAVRNSPGGQSRAGLDNFNMVEVYRQDGNWSCVRVLQGPNSRVAGIEGWVNSSYLECDQRNCYRACPSLIETRNAVNARTRPGICSR